MQNTLTNVTRVVVLPNGRDIPLGTYVRKWRMLIGMSPGALIRDFDYYPATASEVLAKLRFGIHDRINRHLPGYGVGRKWCQDWQRQTAHTARAVNTPRLAVHWLPAEFRARLAHRLFQD